MMSDIQSIFIDTWGWLALAHRQDQHHQNVKDLYKNLRQSQVRIYTSDYVLDELISLLFRRENFDYSVRFMEGILQNSHQGRFQIENVNQARFLLALGLRKQFQEKPKISFTDFTSMVIMQELGIQYVLTEDEHYIQVGLGFIKVRSL
ncbi:MAG: type II toxin-antitoxin system VapC family toxin [Microcystaceae cyanobacterium]